MTSRPDESRDAGRAGPGRWGWLLLLLPFLAVVGSLTLSYLWNEDFWWYLTSGRAILEEGGIPDQDPFLYTSGNGIGWVFHSWLWTVLVALLEKLAGLEGVVVFHALLAMAITALLYTTARADRLGLVNALAVLLFLTTIRHRLCGKAEVATWLMVILFYHLLERPGPFGWRRGVALGALQLLWANLHGGYPLGIFLALCYSVGGWLEARRDRSRGRESRGSELAARRPPLWFPLLLFVVAVADPWLFKERLAPFGFVTGAETVQPVGETGTLLILEWRSPFSAFDTDPIFTWLFAVAATAGLLSFFVARRWSPPRLFFLLGMAGLGASAIRHLSGFALAAALVLISNFAERKPRARAAPKGKRARPSVGTSALTRRLYPVSCGALAVLLIATAVSLRIARPGFDGGQSVGFFTMRPAMACPGAADFILERKLSDPIFNDYQLGAYLSYRLYPEHRLFIDTRVLDPSLVVDYTEMVESEARWKRAESRYGFRTVVLGNYSKTVRSALGSALLRDPRWQLAYVDPLAVVFVKDGASAARTVARLRLRNGEERRAPFTTPPGLIPAAVALERLLLGDLPANYLVEYLAVLGHLGQTRAVRDLATEALAEMPKHPLLYRQRCAAHFVLGDASAALDDCAQAFALDPGDAQIVGLYCSVLESTGKRDQALEILAEALRRNPKDSRLWQLRQQLAGSR